MPGPLSIDALLKYGAADGTWTRPARSTRSMIYRICRCMKNVVVVIGAGQIGQAIARRVGGGKHVVLADRSEGNANAAAEVMANAGYEVSVAVVDVTRCTRICSRSAGTRCASWLKRCAGARVARESIRSVRESS